MQPPMDETRAEIKIEVGKVTAAGGGRWGDSARGHCLSHLPLCAVGGTAFLCSVSSTPCQGALLSAGIATHARTRRARRPVGVTGPLEAGRLALLSRPPLPPYPADVARGGTHSRHLALGASVVALEHMFPWRWWDLLSPHCWREQTQHCGSNIVEREGHGWWMGVGWSSVFPIVALKMPASPLDPVLLPTRPLGVSPRHRTVEGRSAGPPLPLPLLCCCGWEAISAPHIGSRLSCVRKHVIAARWARCLFTTYCAPFCSCVASTSSTTIIADRMCIFCCIVKNSCSTFGRSRFISAHCVAFPCGSDHTHS